MDEKLGKQHVLVMAGISIICTWSLYRSRKGVYAVQKGKRLYVTPMGEPASLNGYKVEYKVKLA